MGTVDNCDTIIRCYHHYHHHHHPHLQPLPSIDRNPSCLFIHRHPSRTSSQNLVNILDVFVYIKPSFYFLHTKLILHTKTATTRVYMATNQWKRTFYVNAFWFRLFFGLQKKKKKESFFFSANRVASPAHFFSTGFWYNHPWMIAGEEERHKRDIAARAKIDIRLRYTNCSAN